MLKLLCNSKNGKKVFVDLENSHAATHIRRTPRLYEIAKEVISSMDLIENEYSFDKELDDFIGVSDLVVTDSTDEIMYARRPNREKFTRFVKNRMGELSKFVTIDIKKNLSGQYYLHTIYIGKNTPKIPGGKLEDPNSRDFWSKHALVWGNQEIIPGSETSLCPW